MSQILIKPAAKGTWHFERIHDGQVNDSPYSTMGNIYDYAMWIPHTFDSTARRDNIKKKYIQPHHRTHKWNSVILIGFKKELSGVSFFVTMYNVIYHGI